MSRTFLFEVQKVMMEGFQISSLFWLNIKVTVTPLDILIAPSSVLNVINQQATSLGPSAAFAYSRLFQYGNVLYLLFLVKLAVGFWSAGSFSSRFLSPFLATFAQLIQITTNFLKCLAFWQKNRFRHTGMVTDFAY